MGRGYLRKTEPPSKQGESQKGEFFLEPFPLSNYLMRSMLTEGKRQNVEAANQLERD